MENGFDRPDDASKNSCCEITIGVGDVVDAMRHVGVDKKCAKEAILKDIKGGVDEDSVGEMKHIGNNESLEIDKNEEVKEDSRGSEERQHKDAGDALDCGVREFFGKPLHVDKKDAEKDEEEFETIENGFDRPDDASKNSSCEIAIGVGDVVDAIRHVGVDKKCAKEAILKDIKGGVDEDSVGELKHNGNNESLEIDKNEEVKEDSRGNEERQQNDAGDALDRGVREFFGKPLHVDKDAEKDEEEFETIDAKEVVGKVKSCGEKDYNKDVEDVGVPNEKQEEKVVDSLKNGNAKLVEQQMSADNYNVTKGVEDIAGISAMQTINDVKDNGEKNEHGDEKDDRKDSKEKGDDSDVKDGRERGIEVKANKVDNVVVGLKDSKHVHVVKKMNGYEEKSEMETTIKEETTKANETKDLVTAEMEVVEDAIVNEKHDEKDGVISMEYEEQNATVEDDANEDDDGGNIENVIIDKVSNSLKRERGTGRGNVEGKTKESTKAKEKRKSEQNAKDLSSTPLSSSRERPVRERKSVERLVEVIEKEPDRAAVIEKGRGTPLKDIPNVAYKLARKKPADLKFLHQALFGRKGKVVDFKNNLRQFSGFAWHESEEKRRLKIKEKLDKCHKDALLDLANLFDLTASTKASIKKEEVIVKLLDFLEAPAATTDIIVAEEQLAKHRKRKRDAKSSASKSSRGTATENSRKKSAKTGGTTKLEGKIMKDMKNDDEEEMEDDTQICISDEDDANKQSESDVKETESLEADEEGKIVCRDSAEGKAEMQTNTKQQNSGNPDPPERKEHSNSKLSTQMAVKSPVKDDGNEKVFSRKKRNVESTKRSKPKPNVKDSSSGKKEKTAVAKEQKSGPSRKDLRKTICEILKEVDFNTATFIDILKMLGTHYMMDLTPRKSVIKQMIQEELTKMAHEAEDDENGEEEVARKKETSRPAGKKLKA